MKNIRTFLINFLLLFLIVISGCISRVSNDEIRRNVDTIWNKGDINLIDKLYSADFVLHRPGQDDLKGTEAFKQHVLTTRSAFPDLKFTMEEIVIEGNKGAASWAVTGTNTGKFKISNKEIPATGRQIKVSGISIWHVKDGKVLDEFAVSDSLGLMQQLGLMPR